MGLRRGLIPAFPSVLLALPAGHLSSFTSSSLLNSFRLGFTRWTVTGIEIGLSRKAARLRIKNGLYKEKTDTSPTENQFMGNSPVTRKFDCHNDIRTPNIGSKKTISSID